MSISFPPVEMELTREFVAGGPAVEPLTMTVVLEEKPFIVLKDTDKLMLCFCLKIIKFENIAATQTF